MSIAITAIYERGILRPLQEIALKEHQRVRVFLEPNIRWCREFKALLERIHKRAIKFSSAEIEKDIAAASRQIRKIKDVYKSSS